MNEIKFLDFKDNYKITPHEEALVKQIEKKPAATRMELADIMQVELSTVSYHLEKLYKKMGTKSKQEFIAKLLKELQ